MKIQNWRQIYLFTEQGEFRNVRNPFLVWSSCAEIPIKQIGRYFVNFAFIGTVLSHPDTADQPLFLHEPLYGFVVKENLSLP